MYHDECRSVGNQKNKEKSKMLLLDYQKIRKKIIAIVAFFLVFLMAGGISVAAERHWGR
jgi:hypothetical protein